MILNESKTKAFMCATKTGSTFVQDNLIMNFPCTMERGTYWGSEKIQNRVKSRDVIDKHPTLKSFGDRFDFDKIELWGSWRDPVQRFISSVNFCKRFPGFIRNMINPDKDFNEFLLSFDYVGVDLDKEPAFLLNPSQWELMPKKYSDAVYDIPYSKFINTDSTAGVPNTPITSDSSRLFLLFLPQTDWLGHPGTRLLDFDHLSEHAWKMIKKWGGNSIHAIGTNRGMSLTREPIDQRTIDAIHDIYAEDYKLQANIGKW